MSVCQNSVRITAGLAVLGTTTTYTKGKQTDPRLTGYLATQPPVVWFVLQKEVLVFLNLLPRQQPMLANKFLLLWKTAGKALCLGQLQVSGSITQGCPCHKLGPKKQMTATVPFGHLITKCFWRVTFPSWRCPLDNQSQ